MVNNWKLPIKTDWMKSQMNHEPTRVYAEEIYQCIKNNKSDYKNALEIGAAWGVSSLSILLAGDGKLTSVDINPKVKTPKEINANNFEDRHEFINSSSEEFYKKNDETFDILQQKHKEKKVKMLVKADHGTRMLQHESKLKNEILEFLEKN